MENWMNMSSVTLKCLKGSKSIICQKSAYALEDSVQHDSGSLFILDYVSQCYVSHEVQQK